MHAVVSRNTEEVESFTVHDRFDFEDRCLGELVPSRPCKASLEHHPGPDGVRVILLSGGGNFEARPYLEFEKHILGRTHFLVMQEGEPTDYTVVMD